MDVAKPQFLGYVWILWTFTAFAALLVAQQAYAHKKWFASRLSSRYGPSFSAWRAFLKLGLWAAAMFYLLTALATPLGKPIKVKSEAVGADVILAIDVSSSMYAQDIKPNRLIALKTALKSLLGRLGGDRVGIVAFAGEAVVACPLTSDYDTAALFLDKLETDSVPRDGTGLGPALRACLDKFSEPGKRGRIIILATDGEDNTASDAITQAKRAADLGIPVYTLGIGTPGGALVPGRPDIFGRVLAKMYKGKPVRTKLDDKTLKKIASETGGAYFYGASGQAMAQAYERVRQLKQGKAKAREKFVREPLYQEALLIAVILLLIESLLSNRSGGTRRLYRLVTEWFRRKLALRRGTTTVALLMFLSPGLFGFSLDPGREEYSQGNAAYYSGDYETAARKFDESIQQQERPEAWFNLGNSLFRMQDYGGAVSAFEKAMELSPDDKDAVINYGLAREMMEKQQEQGGQQQNQDQKKQDQKKQGDKKQQGQQQQAQQGEQGGQQGQGGEESLLDKLNPFGDDKQQANQGQPQQGQAGQGQQARKSEDEGKNKSGDAEGQLSQDQIHAIMNMMKNDQKRFSTQFEPLKKHNKDKQAQDPLQQMLQRMSGLKMPKKDQGSNSDVKEW